MTTKSWHPADLWLVFLMIILNSLAIISLAVYIGTSYKIIEAISKKPLTE